MTEYIEREKAIEAAIDAADEWDGGYNPHRAVQIRDGIKEIPAADVRPVVLCKDCKHYQFADNRAFGMPVKRCEWTGFEDVDDDDFCSRAERRTDE